MTEQSILTPPPRRFHPAVLVVLLAVVVLAAAAVAFVAVRHTGVMGAGTGKNAATAATTTTVPFTVTSTTPATGTANVSSSQVVTVSLSRPVTGRLDSADTPTFNPPVTGTWVRTGDDTLTFQATAPFIPTATETLTVPAGKDGIHGKGGATLSAPVTTTFTVAQATTERLQQLLAVLNYLPLSFTPSGPAPAAVDDFDPQPGAFAWRWPDTPASLTSQWAEGADNVITKGAVMAFEDQHGLTVDGLAGQQVWATLLDAWVTDKLNPQPYTYVYVSKVLPETLTLYENGATAISGILVNTGAPGADTQDGTFPVFEHVTSSRMVGTNPDGSHYDDPDVPWASYFNGGDALHGFVRAQYGYPQSNGCVEMAIPNAAAVWPLTPIGTLVTVDGPSS